MEYVSLGRTTVEPIDITAEITNNSVSALKREAVYSDGLTDEDFQMFLNRASWETPHHSRRVKRAVGSSEWSRENATTFCREKVLGSQITSSCMEVASIDTDEIIRQCSDDVFVSLM